MQTFARPRALVLVAADCNCLSALHSSATLLPQRAARLKAAQTASATLQVRNRDDVLTCARHMHTDSLAPVFLTSSVTGSGLELVRLFYNLLPQRQRW